MAPFSWFADVSGDEDTARLGNWAPRDRPVRMRDGVGTDDGVEPK
jgi:hypothetical protein